METPDQLLERLERMGEQRVRALLGMRQFESKTLPLVKGWLSKLERARAGDPFVVAASESRESLGMAVAMARHASEAAENARECASRSGENAKQAQRLAVIAVAVGSTGLVVSILTLLVLAMR